MKKFLIFFLLLIIGGCAPVEIPKEMVHLDQAYVPVWLASEASDLELTSKRLDRLSANWKLFILKYNDLLESEEDNRETFRLLQEWFDDLNYCLANGDELCVKVKLDQFKFELQELRTFWDIDYSLDYVWDFEASLAEIIPIASDPKLQLLEWNEFIPHLKALNEIWDRLDEHEINVEFLEWDSRKFEKYNQIKSEISGRMDCLNGLTEGAQLEEILACSIEIQKLNHELIGLFAHSSYTPEINL